MADSKITDLTLATSTATGDLLTFVLAAGGAGSNRKIAVDKLLNFAGGTVTTNQPIIDITRTWNAGGVTFTFAKYTLTDTASAAASVFIDLIKGSTRQFAIRKDGFVEIAVGSSYTWTAQGGLSSTGDGLFKFLNNAGTAGSGNLTSGIFTPATGTITTSQPAISVTQTWNASGVTFEGILADFTSTASAAASLAINLKVGGASIFGVGKLGVVTAAAAGAYNFIGRGGLSATADGAFSLLANDGTTKGSLRVGTVNFGTASSIAADSSLYITANSVLVSYIDDSSMRLKSSVVFGWGSAAATTTIDVPLLRHAARSLALRDAANAMELRISNTYTDASNYETGLISWQTTANVLTIGTAKAGTGADRAVNFIMGGVTQFSLPASGVWNVSFPGTATVSSTFSVGSIGFNAGSRSVISSPSDGIILATNNAGSAFTGIKLGGTSASFPYIKVSGAGLLFRVADDTANCAIEALSVKTSAPSGGTAGTWKHGILVTTGTSVLKTTEYVELDIGGTLVKLATVTNS